MGIYVLIMAGGVGSRFWPRSRKKSPKQLLNIFGEQSMIQETYFRIKDFVNPENIFVITNKVQKALIEDQLPKIPPRNIIAEPVGRNTAPCIGLAAQLIDNIEQDSVIVTLPADHLIRDQKKFTETLERGIKFAGESKGLLTFGITPTRPETGYGYINYNKAEVENKIHRVKRFVEKPDRNTAEQYLSSGEYLWNSGMFIWRADAILNELKTHLPSLYSELQKLKRGLNDAALSEVISTIYENIESVSIDYGIMEKSDNVFLIEGDFGWSDVGSWETVYEVHEKDKNGNAVTGDVFLDESKNSYVYSPSKFSAVLGIENLIVINTDDALLVCDRTKTQDVKKVVDYLNKGKRLNLI